MFSRLHPTPVSRTRWLALILALSLVAVLLAVLAPRARTATADRKAVPRFVLLDPQSIPKFVNPLPNAFDLKIKPTRPGGNLYVVRMSQFAEDLGLGLKDPITHKPVLTTVWGYNGTYPGPTFRVWQGRPIRVKFINALPTTHLLWWAYDANLHGTNMGEPEVKAIVHLHGGHVPPAADGFPDEAYAPGRSKTHAYPNDQKAATLWYHDHGLGVTRLNVYAGLAGFYIIHSKAERKLDLPDGRFDIPIAIQDKTFRSDGSLYYDVRDPNEIPTSAEHPGPWVPEFFGDTIIVNGKAWPFLATKARSYRFRLLNGSNARFYHLRLVNKAGKAIWFKVIGDEQGLLAAPVTANNIVMAPGERYEIVVNFKHFKGETITMTNDAPVPYPDGDDVDPETTGKIMQFRVAKGGVRDDDRVPAVLDPAAGKASTDALVAAAVQTRDVTLEEVTDASDNPVEVLLNGRHWGEELANPTFKPKLGTAEVWQFINLTVDTHPMHLHDVKFKIVDRQQFDAAAYTADLAAYRADPVANDQPDIDDYLIGAPVLPAAYEAGWKDTARAAPGWVTRVATRFDDYTGIYPYHCHIVDHEDNEMMLPFQVVP